MYKHYFVLIFFYFCGFISVAYTTLNKLLAVFFMYNVLYIDDLPTADDRPLIWKISNGDISATGYPNHFMFGYRVYSYGFSLSTDRKRYFQLNKIQWEEKTMGGVIRLVTI